MSRAIRSLNLAGALGMLALPIMGLLSVFLSDFVPSALTVAYARVLAIGTGAFYGLFFVGIGHFGWDTNNPGVAAVMQSRSSLAKCYVRVPLTALVFFGFAWMSLSSALPWMINAVLGSDNSITVVIDGWQNTSWSRAGSQCARPTLRGVPFGMLGRGALCVPYQERIKFKAGASMTLYGRSSVFGISPTRYRLLDR
jgi:hypothetical protein